MPKITQVLRQLDGLLLRSSVRALIIFGLFVTVALGVVSLRMGPGSFGVDFWQHLAAFRYLAANTFSPAFLYFGVPYEVHLYTPYHVFWGMVGALTKLDVSRIAIAAALSNLVLFFVGCRLSAKYLLGDHRLDAAVSLALLFLWGTPVWWSGVYSFGQIAVQAVYPSFFVFSAMLALLAIHYQAVGQNIYYAILLVLVISVLFVSHPITAGVLLVLLILKTLALTGWRPGAAGWTVGICMGGIGLGLFWPYFSVLELITEAGAFGDNTTLYQAPLAQLGFALSGSVALLFIHRDRILGFLASALGVFVLAYGINYLFQFSHIFARAIIYIALIFQLALLRLMALLGRRGVQGASLMFIILLLPAGLNQARIAANNNYAIYWDLTEGRPLGQTHYLTQFADLQSLELKAQTPDGVILVPRDWAYPIVAVTGLKVVATLLRPPTLPSFRHRAKDVERFFDLAVSCVTRKKIIARWSADYIVTPTGSKANEAVAGCHWPTILQNDYLVVRAVPDNVD